MLQPRIRHIWYLFTAASLVIVLGCSLISALSTPTEQVTPPTAQQKVRTASPGSFPLAGIWSGFARNGSFEMEVSISIRSECKADIECGTFDLKNIPCSGSFTLLNEIEGVYEFKAGRKQGTCGDGRDFLQLLPDGRLKYTSRGDYGETLGILYPEPESNQIKKLWAIYDDDGSPDGTTALLYLLSEQAVELKAVSISYGEAHPAIYIQHIGRVLDEFGIPDIPLGAGQDAPLAGNNEFPEWIREASDGFWGIPIPNRNKNYPVQNAAELMVTVIHQSPEPVTIFLSGPCTNLAQALRLDQKIRNNIAAVYIMGGAINVSGNVHDFYPEDKNTVAEWNIYSDPQAAREVFESGLRIFLIPLDATNQVTVNSQDTRQWRKGGHIADMAADFYDMLLANNQNMSIWDVMTSTIMVQPGLCGFEPVHLEVVTSDGITSGQIITGDDSKPVINVCLYPDGDAIKQKLIDTFSLSQ